MPTVEQDRYKAFEQRFEPSLPRRVLYGQDLRTARTTTFPAFVHVEGYTPPVRLPVLVHPSGIPELGSLTYEVFRRLAFLNMRSRAILGGLDPYDGEARTFIDQDQFRQLQNGDTIETEINVENYTRRPVELPALCRFGGIIINNAKRLVGDDLIRTVKEGKISIGGRAPERLVYVSKYQEEFGPTGIQVPLDVGERWWIPPSEETYIIDGDRPINREQLAEVRQKLTGYLPDGHFLLLSQTADPIVLAQGYTGFLDESSYGHPVFGDGDRFHHQGWSLAHKAGYPWSVIAEHLIASREGHPAEHGQLPTSVYFEFYEDQD